MPPTSTTAWFGCFSSSTPRSKAIIRLYCKASLRSPGVGSGVGGRGCFLRASRRPASVQIQDQLKRVVLSFGKGEENSKIAKRMLDVPDGMRRVYGAAPVGGSRIRGGCRFRTPYGHRRQN